MWKAAIDTVKGPENEYKKKMTQIYNALDEVIFKKEPFTRLELIRYKK